MLQRLLFITLLIPAFTFSMDNEVPDARHETSMPDGLRAQLQGMRVGRLARDITDTTNMGWMQGIWIADSISRQQEGWVDWGIHLVPAALGMVWGYTYRDRHATDTVGNNSQGNNSQDDPTQEGSE